MGSVCSRQAVEPVVPPASNTPEPARAGRSPRPLLAAVSEAELKTCQAAVDELLDKTNAGPVMVRLAWHDSGTYDARITAVWPKAGGAVGSIMYKVTFYLECMPAAPLHNYPHPRIPQPNPTLENPQPEIEQAQGFGN